MIFRVTPDRKFFIDDKEIKNVSDYRIDYSVYDDATQISITFAAAQAKIGFEYNNSKEEEKE